jgi:hypothetical protein
MSSSGTELTHDQVRVGDERLGVIHSGSRYTLGFGRDYYGIWEQGAPGGPTQRFPASKRGQEAAWKRYVELEPSAEEDRAAEFARDEVEEPKRTWTRGRLITVGVLAGAVILGVVLLQINKSGTSSGGSGAVLGDTAHLNITGAANAGEDLTLKAFKFTGFGSLYPNVEATWTGPTTTLHMLISIPQVGAISTSQVPSRRVELTVLATASPSGSASAAVSGSPAPSPSGTASEGQLFSSFNGECTVTFTDVEEKGIAGSLDCKGVSALTSSTTTIDAKGTFAAKS